MSIPRQRRDHTDYIGRWEDSLLGSEYQIHVVGFRSNYNGSDEVYVQHPGGRLVWVTVDQLEAQYNKVGGFLVDGEFYVKPKG